jgi:hypothetical protein
LLKSNLSTDYRLRSVCSARKSRYKYSQWERKSEYERRENQNISLSYLDSRRICNVSLSMAFIGRLVFLNELCTPMFSCTIADGNCHVFNFIHSHDSSEKGSFYFMYGSFHAETLHKNFLLINFLNHWKITSSRKKFINFAFLFKGLRWRKLHARLCF